MQLHAALHLCVWSLNLCQRLSLISLHALHLWSYLHSPLAGVAENQRYDPESLGPMHVSANLGRANYSSKKQFAASMSATLP